MHDMQRIMDVMSSAARHSRSDYHLTLGAAISTLERTDSSAAVVVDTGGAPGPVDSYRGYYADLAFPRIETATVGAVLADLKAALGATFEGYKGGDFVMDADTPLWVAEYGCASGTAVVGLKVGTAEVALITRQNR